MKKKKAAKFLGKVINFFKIKTIARNLVVLAFCLVIAILYVGITRHFKMPSALETIISFIFGLILSLASVAVLAIPFRVLEDKLKVSLDDETLLRFYGSKRHGEWESDYLKTVKINGTEFKFMYKPIFVNKDWKDFNYFKIKDDENKKFKLDDFIVNNYLSLFSSHTESYVKNCVTIRLDKCEENKNGVTLYTSRSTYYNHLVTNRAIDYKIQPSLTLRSYYDEGPEVRSLEDSMMSNHIGINAIVCTKDEYILLPQRGKHATISKNAITSSIAVRLTLPKDGKVTNKYVLNDYILRCLDKRLRLNNNKINNKDVEVDFLGLGQNIYEGGKPQFYYLVVLNNVTKDNFGELSVDDKDVKKIDEDKCIYAVKRNELKFKGDRITFTYYSKKKGKDVKLRKALKFERSFAANIWHYQKCEENLNKNKKHNIF